ncbi:hypothetical protein SHIRM173S_00400 [Streptomyces hirsutus]
MARKPRIMNAKMIEPIDEPMKPNPKNREVMVLDMPVSKAIRPRALPRSTAKPATRTPTIMPTAKPASTTVKPAMAKMTSAVATLIGLRGDCDSRSSALTSGR